MIAERPARQEGHSMSMDTLYSLINASVLPAWILLIFAPRWRVTTALVHSLIYPVVLGVFYTICLGLAVFGGMGSADAGFGTIAAVRGIFATDIGVLTGWAHYLVFDLFVGAWEARDAQRRGFNHWLLIPCLLLTFMAGPLGLVIYMILRAATRKGGWRLGEG